MIDERFNGGGHAADYIIDYLKKPLNSYWAVRDGEDFRQPFGTMPGPKAMIVNEYAGSGGDYMPWHIPSVGYRAADRQAHLGRPGWHRRLSAR